MKIGELFRIRREERWIAVAALLLLVGLNALCICKYYGLFTPLSDNYWNLLVGRFHVSGFDSITYYMVSDWEVRYNVYRHPLLSFLMWIPYIINQGCMALWGINCAQFIVAILLIFAGFYSFIFMHRICRDVLSLERIDAALLSFMLFSFAYIMLSAMVPDHFILSMFMLLLTLYVAGMLIKSHRHMTGLQTIVLFLCTAGLSLNNGLKVFLAALFTNGKRFFHWRYLLFAILLPAMLLWIGARFEYHYLVAPHEKARHEARAKRKAEQQKRTAQMKPATSQPHKTAKPRPRKTGTPISNGEFMRFTDISTPRLKTAVENLFGESIQLHPDYLLQDVLRFRPMIVEYRWTINYVVEALLVLLFAVGIWCGRRSRFLWLCLSWFALDMLLHLGLGFGINEVYIMTAHWAFVIPIAIGFSLKALAPKPRMVMRAVLSLLTIYLYCYNGLLIIKYMLC